MHTLQHVALQHKCFYSYQVTFQNFIWVNSWQYQETLHQIGECNSCSIETSNLFKPGLYFHCWADAYLCLNMHQCLSTLSENKWVLMEFHSIAENISVFSIFTVVLLKITDQTFFFLFFFPSASPYCLSIFSFERRHWKHWKQ